MPVAYQARRPERTVLYQTVQEHLETFLAQAEAAESPVPSFVQDELYGFLRCGIFAHGTTVTY